MDSTYGMCGIHASGRWFDTHKPRTENLKPMTKDFEALKSCPILSIVESRVAHDLMVAKWTTV